MENRKNHYKILKAQKQEELKAVEIQLSQTLNNLDEVRLKRSAEDILQKIEQLDKKIKEIDKQETNIDYIQYIRLTGKHHEKLQANLIDAFPDKASLERMLTFEELSKTEDVVAKYANSNTIGPAGRAVLSTLQEKISLTQSEVDNIEAEVFHPNNEHMDNLKKYRVALLEEVEFEYPLAKTASDNLSTLQHLLGLRDEDIAPIKQEIIDRLSLKSNSSHSIQIKPSKFTNSDSKKIYRQLNSAFPLSWLSFLILGFLLTGLKLQLMGIDNVVVSPLIWSGALIWAGALAGIGTGGFGFGFGGLALAWALAWALAGAWVWTGAWTGAWAGALVGGLIGKGSEIFVGALSGTLLGAAIVGYFTYIGTWTGMGTGCLILFQWLVILFASANLQKEVALRYSPLQKFIIFSISSILGLTIGSIIGMKFEALRWL